MQNVTNLKAVPDPGGDDPTPQPWLLVGEKGGLLTLNLAHAVAERVHCGFNDHTERYYTYADGVWTPGGTLIEAVIADLLGNDYRKTHKTNALDMIRHLDTTTSITGEPPNPRFINTINGMVDWATGDVLPHSPDHLSTVQLPVRYNPDATCPAFDRFLSEVLPVDCIESSASSPGFIWELIGYAMYSGNPLHIAVLLHGSGRNGKGVFLRVLNALLGTCNTSSVGLHELTDNRFRAATLYGKLANVAGDLDSKWIANTAASPALCETPSPRGAGSRSRCRHQNRQPPTTLESPAMTINELKQELQARFAEIIADLDGPPPGERCQECGLCDAIGLFLPEKYAPHYSPSSFSPSELVARCVVCVERWQHNISKRTTKPPFRWL